LASFFLFFLLCRCTQGFCLAVTQRPELLHFPEKPLSSCSSAALPLPLLSGGPKTGHWGLGVTPLRPQPPCPQHLPRGAGGSSPSCRCLFSSSNSPLFHSCPHPGDSGMPRAGAEAGGVAGWPGKGRSWWFLCFPCLSFPGYKIEAKAAEGARAAEQRANSRRLRGAGNATFGADSQPEAREQRGCSCCTLRRMPRGRGSKALGPVAGRAPGHGSSSACTRAQNPRVIPGATSSMRQGPPQPPSCHCSRGREGQREEGGRGEGRTDLNLPRRPTSGRCSSPSTPSSRCRTSPTWRSSCTRER